MVKSSIPLKYNPYFTLNYATKLYPVYCQSYYNYLLSVTTHTSQYSIRNAIKLWCALIKELPYIQLFLLYSAINYKLYP